MFAKKSAKGDSFVIAGDITPESVGEGIERKVLGYDDNLMMVSIRFEKDAVGALHHHVHRQVSYVQSGRFEVSIGETKKVLQPGDCFFVAPDIVHGVVALEESVLIDIFAPAREDFM